VGEEESGKTNGEGVQRIGFKKKSKQTKSARKNEGKGRWGAQTTGKRTKSPGGRRASRGSEKQEGEKRLKWKKGGRKKLECH